MNGLFAENLRKLREERGLSQKQLGNQMFVNHSTIARWENGTRLPDATIMGVYPMMFPRFERLGKKNNI